MIAFVLMVIAMAITVAVLAIGLFAMMRKGSFDAKKSNQLMRFRIIAQFIAIFMFILGLILQKANM